LLDSRCRDLAAEPEVTPLKPELASVALIAALALGAVVAYAAFDNLASLVESVPHSALCVLAGPLAC